eukprot:12206808-Prorocentrum_lima.AAC.1
MTSSLVGSEMCIRDRHCMSDSSESPPSPFCDSTTARGIGVILRFKMPVSYTHLTLPTICSV